MIDKEDIIIRQFKLTNGDEILSVVENHDRHTVTLSHVVQYIESNSNGFGLKPWINVNDNISTQVILNASSIVATVIPDNTVSNYYFEAVASLISQEEDTTCLDPSGQSTDKDTVH